MPARWLRRTCPLSPEVEKRALLAAERLRLSARAWHRLLRVSRTVADLEGADSIVTLDYLETAFGAPIGEPDIY